MVLRIQTANPVRATDLRLIAAHTALLANPIFRTRPGLLVQGLRIHQIREVPLDKAGTREAEMLAKAKMEEMEPMEPMEPMAEPRTQKVGIQDNPTVQRMEIMHPEHLSLEITVQIQPQAQVNVNVNITLKEKAAVKPVSQKMKKTMPWTKIRQS